jgi:outer membrane protein OmpA-like peptidoglycan-associated protein
VTRWLAILLGLLAGACAEQRAPAPEADLASAGTKESVTPPPPPAPRLKAEVSSLSADRSGLNVRITEFGTVLELPTDTLFEFDRSDLAPAAEANLVKAADLIRRSGSGPIQVIGHTDAKGEDAYNLALSSRRAEAVAAWLRQQVGVRQRQITTSGKGEAEPIAPNARPDGGDDPAGRARNRRVELIIANA